MKMKMTYIVPEVEIIEIETSEVIAASPAGRYTRNNGPIGSVTDDSKEEPEPGGSMAKRFSLMDDQLSNAWGD